MHKERIAKANDLYYNKYGTAGVCPGSRYGMERNAGMSGKLIVIEGLDGSGKSTQTPLLEAALRERGVFPRVISFPDYGDPSSTLVRMYLAGEFGTDADAVNAYAASSFYAVDRYAAYVRHWREDYCSGKMVLATRYTTSNVMHQMSKLPQEQWEEYLAWLDDFEYCRMGIPRPDLVLFLDMPNEASQTLLSGRYGGDETKKDLHENNIEYLARCRKAADYAAARLEWKVIPCAQEGVPCPVEEIHRRVMKVVEKELSL